MKLKLVATFQATHIFTTLPVLYIIVKTRKYIADDKKVPYLHQNHTSGQ